MYTFVSEASHLSCGRLRQTLCTSSTFETASWAGSRGGSRS